MDIYFYEAFEKEAERLRHYLPRDHKAEYTLKTIQECGHLDPPAPIISIRPQTTIPASWADRIRAVITRSTGFDHILRYRLETGVNVPAGYLPEYCTRAVAEQALMLWMALMRRLPEQIEHYKTFNRDGLTGRETEGRTLVVVGVGNIGYQVVRIGWGLGMRVLGVDIDRKHRDVEYLPAEKALAQADLVVCSMNLTAENRGYFTADLLRNTPRGALFVNVSRGELSPSSALLELLEDGHLGAVGLDVFDAESELAVALRGGPASTHPEVRASLALAARTDTILTPHNAFNTAEAVERKSEQTVRQYLHFKETGAFIWPVPEGNGEVISDQ